ncbi:hypothetical protein AB1Y20_010420 [Prymnesium parvum]|uniref:Sulfotransferase n=1 Tax=Prymnesium parvum TaxID=97485 RepID=A0AB34IPH5_PRYPA
MRLCRAAAVAAVAIPLTLLLLAHREVLVSRYRRGPPDPTAPRPLLLVGTQSSGTANSAAALARLGLQLAHEHADSSLVGAADGTASWFHGIRHLDGAAPAALLRWLCASRRERTGFLGARMFAPPREACVAWPLALLGRLAASLPNSDGLRGLEWAERRLFPTQCAQAQCEATVNATWGCASRGGRCEVAYATTLLQARHPLRTLESLAVKFCRSLDQPPRGDFVQMVRLMFASHRWEEHTSCLGVFSSYLVLYLEPLLRAVDRGQIDGMFRVEETGPCVLFRLGGFHRLHEAAEGRAVCAANGSAATPPVVNAHNHNGAVLRIGAAELNKYVEPRLVRRLHALASRLGYDLLAPPAPPASGRAQARPQAPVHQVGRSWRQSNAWRQGGGR